MKSSLGLRPVHHRREDRIRGHIQLCALALLLIRVIETTTSEAAAALARPGRYRSVAGNLRVKEVAVAPGGDGDGDGGSGRNGSWSATTPNRPTVTSRSGPT